MARQVSPAASSPTSRHAMRPASSTARPSASNGTTTTLMASAAALDMKIDRNPIVAASGRSARRDQPKSTPPAAASTRCCARSNQFWPFSRSRTCCSRMISSGWPNRRLAIASMLVTSSSAQIMVHASAARAYNSGAKAGRLRSSRMFIRLPCCHLRVQARWPLIDRCRPSCLQSSPSYAPPVL